MLEKMRNMVKQKGQGIVEYALILAFVVGVGMMLNGADLGGAVKGVFEDVGDYIAGDDAYTAAIRKWGKTSKENFPSNTSDERLKADQQALANLAEFFVGKSGAYIASILKNQTADNSDVLLGHFVESDNGGTAFNYGNLNNNVNGVDLFAWMQGKEAGSITYSDKNNYVFSDYSINNYHTSTKDTGGLKIRLQYDKPNNTTDKSLWTVTAARVAIDSKSQSSGVSSSSSSYGLGVEVRKGVDGYKQIVGTPNGIPKF